MQRKGHNTMAVSKKLDKETGLTYTTALANQYAKTSARFEGGITTKACPSLIKSVDVMTTQHAGYAIISLCMLLTHSIVLWCVLTHITLCIHAYIYACCSLQQGRASYNKLRCTPRDRLLRDKYNLDAPRKRKVIFSLKIAIDAAIGM